LGGQKEAGRLKNVEVRLCKQAVAALLWFGLLCSDPI
jgi:hypothetical protein